MKRYIEFFDGCTMREDRLYYGATNELNNFISENKHLKVSVIGYQVVRYERANTERTYILAEVEEIND